MDTSSIYADIAARTGGNIYIGVVGPVRTGKSTFIKRFMETLVLPNITDDYVRERARDELPQSGSGRTIMTAEPKFVPEDAVTIELDATVRASVRLIDSVGYMIPGVNGQYEDGEERLVTTPWYDHEVPMRVAAEEGTRKVIRDHSTIGIVVTTDGSVTELAREDYAPAEARVVAELRDIGKPFLVLLNTADPAGERAQSLAADLSAQYDAACLPVNCQALTEQDVLEILRTILYEFPVAEACFRMPEWMDVLPPDNAVKQQLYALLREQMPSLCCLRQARRTAQALSEHPLLESADVERIGVDTGAVCYVLAFPRALYYDVISEQAGVALHSDGELISFLADMGRIQADYQHIRSALNDVRTKGYGVVAPAPGDLQLAEPEIVRKGGRYGVRLKASAKAIHMFQTNIETEISPEIGGENASSEILGFLLQGFDGDVEQLWQSNIFGKPIYTIAQEGVEEKLSCLPTKAVGKLQETLQRVVNEGSGTLICIIL